MTLLALEAPAQNLCVNNLTGRMRAMSASHDPAKLGARLRELREQRGWRNQAAAARQAKLTRSYLSRLENPAGKPRRPTVAKLLDIASGWALTREERDELLDLAGYDHAEVPSHVTGAFGDPHALTTEELNRHIAVMRAIVVERQRQEARQQQVQRQDEGDGSSGEDELEGRDAPAAP